MFPFVLETLSLLISFELVVQFQWGFLQNVALQILVTINKKVKIEYDRLQTDLD